MDPQDTDNTHNAHNALHASGGGVASGSGATMEPSVKDLAEAEEKLERLKRVLMDDVNLTPEQRDSELKKARIAIMRKLRVRNRSNGC